MREPKVQDLAGTWPSPDADVTTAVGLVVDVKSGDTGSLIISHHNLVPAVVRQGVGQRGDSADCARTGSDLEAHRSVGVLHKDNAAAVAGATEPVKECGRVTAGIGHAAGAHPEHNGKGAGIKVGFPGNRDLSRDVGAETHNSRARHAPAVRAGGEPRCPIVQTIMLRPFRVGIQDQVAYPRRRNPVPDHHRGAQPRAIEIGDP